MIDDRKLTFEEWKHEGFRVLAGQHARHRHRTGDALFTRDQVEEDPYHNDPNTGDKTWHLIHLKTNSSR